MSLRIKNNNLKHFAIKRLILLIILYDDIPLTVNIYTFKTTINNLQSGRIIQNKNVNIIVNVNAQEMAQELWKIIKARLNNQTNHITSSKNIMKDLEEAVIPLVSSTKRDGTSPSAFQVANQLDKITRRALTRDTPAINVLDKEIMARDIVADMMASLKIILSKDNQLKTDKNATLNRKMMHHVITTTMSNDNEQDDYMNIRIKIHRKDILDAFY